MLVVVDTNVWVSALLTPQGVAARLPARMDSGRFTPILCEATIAELIGICLSDRILRKYPAVAGTHLSLVGRIRQLGEVLTDPPIVPVCTDPKDDIFLALAIASSANYLVTGDGDLNDDPKVTEYLRSSSGTRVLTVREFLDLLAQQEGEPIGSPLDSDTND